ncbi:hypothetical protein SAMN05192540_3183 [Maribacter dokdonensis]|uniref:Uncharacterized protein n=1 Tax=Maribacter dokdonensis TaxID=320912 RepID=A0A1H4SJB5_9FLAO|nr:hypothetical protein SAMN05192540_3183 [Maribacter dokdonensis]
MFNKYNKKLNKNNLNVGVIEVIKLKFIRTNIKKYRLKT